mmetsp:Transcript_14653/g.42160  ORF Transcript_14653/g.42160 Transcript_14653/m.42160 type:complete len:344 (-) Transcript_14653:184-1215(-)
MLLRATTDTRSSRRTRPRLVLNDHLQRGLDTFGRRLDGICTEDAHRPFGGIGHHQVHLVVDREVADVCDGAFLNCEVNRWQQSPKAPTVHRHEDAPRIAALREVELAIQHERLPKLDGTGVRDAALGTEQIRGRVPTEELRVTRPAGERYPTITIRRERHNRRTGRGVDRLMQRESGSIPTEDLRLIGGAASHHEEILSINLERRHVLRPLRGEFLVLTKRVAVEAVDQRVGVTSTVLALIHRNSQEPRPARVEEVSISHQAHFKAAVSLERGRVPLEQLHGCLVDIPLLWAFDGNKVRHAIPLKGRNVARTKRQGLRHDKLRPIPAVSLRIAFVVGDSKELL